MEYSSVEYSGVQCSDFPIAWQPVGAGCHLLPSGGAVENKHILKGGVTSTFCWTSKLRLVRYPYVFEQTRLFQFFLNTLKQSVYLKCNL